MTIDYKITSNKGVKMLQCVMYIFLGGVALASNGCVMDDGVIYPDKIEYVSQYSPASVPPG